MARELQIPALPAVPTTDNPELNRFLASLREWVEVRTGRSRAGHGERVVTRQEIQNLGIDLALLQPSTPGLEFGGTGGSSLFDSENIPDPPTNLNVANYATSNVLTWTLPADMGEVAMVAIYASNTQDRSAAQLVGVATSTESHPVTTWTHHAINVKLNYYYWVRAVTWAGVYSTWEPNDALGGLLVPALVGETINELLAKLTQGDYETTYRIIADAFEVIQPSGDIPAYSGTTTYGTNEYVLYDSHYYVSIQSNNLGNQPDISGAYWDDVTSAVDAGKKVFVIGQVDGTPTMGFRGDMLVDGTIMGRHVNADVITGDHIAGQTVTASNMIAHDTVSWTIRSGNYSAGSAGFLVDADPLSPTYGVAEFNQMTMTLNWSSDVHGTGIPAAGATVGATWGSNLNGQPADSLILNGLQEWADIQNAPSFVTAVTHSADIDALQSQIDGNITSWFYDGAPTLANVPASTWSTDTERDNHLGDLYYDNLTGYAYRFYFSGTYGWQQLSDADITAALAQAQTAQDTADSKRRVFVTTPTAPYDIGDLWDTGSAVMRSTVDQTVAYSPSDWIDIADLTDYAAIQAYAQARADAAQAAAEAASDAYGSASVAYASAQSYADAAAQTAQLAAEAYTDGEITTAEASILAAANNYADARELAAVTTASAYTDGEVSDAEAAAIAAAEAYADAQDQAYQTTANAYADGVASAAESAAITSAEAYADARRVEAYAYADGVATQAEQDAITAANAYADAAEAAAIVTANAYADGEVDAEEARAIADATAKANAAQAAAVSAAQVFTESWSEQNADVTASNTANDTSNVAGAAAATVRDNAAGALAAVTEMEADNQLSPAEKLTWTVQWPGMENNHDRIISQATTYGIQAEAVFTDLTTSKNTLETYLTTTLQVWSAPSTATAMTAGVLSGYVADFYDKMAAAVNRIANYSPQASLDGGLDTTDGGLIVRDSGTSDYAHLTGGDLNFYYWNSALLQHDLYQSVNRIEGGTETISEGGTTITIPGVFKNTPKIQLTPSYTPTFNSNYSDDPQEVSLTVTDINLDANGICTFRAHQELLVYNNYTEIVELVDFTGLDWTPAPVTLFTITQTAHSVTIPPTRIEIYRGDGVNTVWHYPFDLVYEVYENNSWKEIKRESGIYQWLVNSFSYLANINVSFTQIRARIDNIGTPTTITATLSWDWCTLSWCFNTMSGCTDGTFTFRTTANVLSAGGEVNWLAIGR